MLAIVNTIEINPKPRLHDILGKATGFRPPSRLKLTYLLETRAVFALDAALVSIDGTSMIVESVSAKYQVIPLKPTGFMSTNLDQRFSNILVTE